VELSENVLEDKLALNDEVEKLRRVEGERAKKRREE
jgi:hypothetical protein